MLQRGMGADYQAEVFLRYVYPAGEYDIYIEGRADGIITQGIQKKTEIVTIDEIKGTYRDIDKMKGAVSVHLAQAKCYAYIYGREHGLAQVRVRLTYCNIDTERVRYFHFEYPMEELAEWFEDMIRQYRKWADFRFAWQKLRTDSIKELSFPFPYRKGQKELASYVYQTIYHKRKLFLEAPTGPVTH